MDDGHLSSLIPAYLVPPSMENSLEGLFISVQLFFFFLNLKSSQVGQAGCPGSW